MPVLPPNKAAVVAGLETRTRERPGPLQKPKLNLTEVSCPHGESQE